VRWGAWLLLAPYLVGALALFAVPALVSFGLVFTRYDGLSAPTWVGFANFRALWYENLVWVAVQNSLYFLMLAVPLRLAAALALALLLQKRRRGTALYRLYRVAVYLPTVIPDAAYALIWLWIFNPLYGPLNLVLRGLGLPAPDWFTDPAVAKLMFVLMSLFQIGEGFVVLLAALKETPGEYYEAAEVLGIGRLDTFQHITLPLLAPWLLLLTCRDVIMSFQYTFTPALLMTGGEPYYATLFLSLMVFEEAFDRFRYGLGAGLMLLTFLASAALIGVLFLAYRRAVNSDE